jgi:hypothetical protein
MAMIKQGRTIYSINKMYFSCFLTNTLENIGFKLIPASSYTFLCAGWSISLDQAASPTMLSARSGEGDEQLLRPVMRLGCRLLTPRPAGGWLAV